MKQYKVYKHPSGTTEAVKQGWSWPGFFFSFIWAMVKKMWGLGVGVLIGFFVLGMIIGAAGGGSGGDALINIVAIIANIIFGVNGNSWREKNPRRPPKVLHLWPPKLLHPAWGDLMH